LQGIGFVSNAGEIIEIIVSDGLQPCILTYEEQTIEITQTDKGYDFLVRQSIGHSKQQRIDINSIKIIQIDNESFAANEQPDIEVEAGKRCINCNGRRICISNGCANTACGWICS